MVLQILKNQKITIFSAHNFESNQVQDFLKWEMLGWV